MIDKKKTSIAIAAIWFERFLECSRTHGTTDFPTSVWRFYHSLLNIGEDKLAIKDIVQKYHDDIWKPGLNEIYKADCKRSHIGLDSRHHVGSRRIIYDMNEQNKIVELFEFIIQTIQDSGIGWPTKEEMAQFHISQE